MVLNIAHRGGAALKPENTLSAFRHALALGCDGAELDVQLTRDGKLAVFHDFRPHPDFCRDAQGRFATSDAPLLRDMTAEELRALDVGHMRDSSHYAQTHPDRAPEHGARIPMLEEIIALVRPHPRFRLFIEIKASLEEPPLSAPGEDIAEATVALLRKKNFLPRATLVGFDWKALAKAKTLAPGLSCWFSTGEQIQIPPRTLAAVILANDGQGWFPHHGSLDAAGIETMHAAGLQVGAWTVNEPERMQMLAALGVDAICTDYPDRLRGL